MRGKIALLIISLITLTSGCSGSETELEPSIPSGTVTPVVGATRPLAPTATWEPTVPATATAHLHAPTATPIPSATATASMACGAELCPKAPINWIQRAIPVELWAAESWLAHGSWATDSTCFQFWSDPDQIGFPDGNPDAVHLPLGNSEVPCHVPLWSDQNCMDYSFQMRINEIEWLVFHDEDEVTHLACSNGVGQLLASFSLPEKFLEFQQFSPEQGLIYGWEHYFFVELEPGEQASFVIKQLAVAADLDDNFRLSPNESKLAIYHSAGGLSVIDLSTSTADQLVQYWPGAETLGIGPVARPTWLSETEIFLPTSDVTQPVIYTIGEDDRQYILEPWLGVTENMQSFYGLATTLAEGGYGLIIYQQTMPEAYYYHSPSEQIERLDANAYQFDQSGEWIVLEYETENGLRVAFRSSEPGAPVSGTHDIQASWARTYLSPNSQYLSVHSRNELKIVELATNELLVHAEIPMPGPEWPAHSWSPSGDYFATFRSFENRPDHELYLFDFSNR